MSKQSAGSCPDHCTAAALLVSKPRPKHHLDPRPPRAPPPRPLRPPRFSPRPPPRPPDLPNGRTPRSIAAASSTISCDAWAATVGAALLMPSAASPSINPSIRSSNQVTCTFSTFLIERCVHIPMGSSQAARERFHHQKIVLELNHQNAGHTPREFPFPPGTR